MPRNPGANQFKEKNCLALLKTPTSTISTQRTVNTPTALGYELPKNKFDKQTSELEMKKKRIAEREK